MADISTITITCILALAALSAVLCLRGKEIKEFVFIAAALITGSGFITASSKAAALTSLILTLVIFLAAILINRNSAQVKTFAWGVVMTALALLSAILYAFTNNSAFLVFTFAVMLPLFPLHGAYVALLTGLPLTVAAFFSILMPIMGLYAIFFMPENTLPFAASLQKIHDSMPDVFAVLGAAGCVYGSLRALVRNNAAGIVAYAGLGLTSILWLGLATGSLDATAALTYMASLGAVTTGLLLAWRCITVRYGEMNTDAVTLQIGGLSHSTPVFAAFFFFLVWAALGLPPFGLFTGLIEILIGISKTVSFWGLAVIMCTWLMASWYFIKFLQKVAFGKAKPGFEHIRLRYREGISLLIMLALLLVLGLGSYANLENTKEGVGIKNRLNTKTLPWKR
ncbi:MAG: proton-conducting transporter membrane subunit [Deltaproteobacteria bacterium]|nr:proton-conducting transporter membrane subunit [Deltaproteobacteria bacterium]